MKITSILPFCAMSAFFASNVGACPCHTNPLTPEQWQKFRAQYHSPAPRRKTASSTMPTLPQFGTSAPWGGSDKTRWRPEAILANATSAALNQAWSLPGTQDAVVAVPVKMLRSQWHPYGDGQSNAVVSFGETWDGYAPPLVATLIRRRDGSISVELRFDAKLAYSGNRIRIRYGSRDVKITGTRDGHGPLIAQWAPPPELGWDSSTQSQVAFVQPDGWNDWFHSASGTRSKRSLIWWQSFPPEAEA